LGWSAFGKVVVFTASGLLQVVLIRLLFSAKEFMKAISVLTVIAEMCPEKQHINCLIGGKATHFSILDYVS
jgi:hypothetical protein